MPPIDPQRILGSVRLAFISRRLILALFLATLVLLWMSASSLDSNRFKGKGASSWSDLSTSAGTLADWGGELASKIPSHRGHTRTWKEHNARTMDRLMDCHHTKTCSENEEKIVILAERYFHESFNFGWNGGEGIWLRSVVRSFERLGISTFYSASNTLAISSFYTLFPGRIKAVLAWEYFGDECLRDRECFRNKENPLGIPLESIFELNYFGCASNPPLTTEKCLAAEPADDTGYLGYEIEEACTAKSIVPHSERPRRVWVLAKRTGYLPYDNKGAGWTYDMLEKVSRELNIEFVGAYEREHDQPDHPLIRNLAKGNRPLSLEEFYTEMSQSLAVLGMGAPPLSPSPWFALCAGVPFINPTNFDEINVGHPWRKGYQHYVAARVGNLQKAEGKQVHVYNVESTDTMGLIDAMRDAIKPHPRFILPDMTIAALDQRVQTLVDTNWTAHAEEVVEVSPELKPNWEATLL